MKRSAAMVTGICVVLATWRRIAIARICSLTGAGFTICPLLSLGFNFGRGRPGIVASFVASNGRNAEKRAEDRTGGISVGGNCPIESNRLKVYARPFHSVPAGLGTLRVPCLVFFAGARLE